MNNHIFLTRDGVCQSDDIDAPHELEINIDDCSGLLDVMVKIKNKYLPKISGGKATWIARSGKPIAVIAQEWKTPKILNDICNPDKIHFEYMGQDDPEAIFKSLLNKESA